MRIRTFRLTLGRLMAIIGVFALAMALTRIDAAPAVSVCIFAACTWYLAARRYAEALTRSVEPLTSRDRTKLAAKSTLSAAIAIGVPDAAFLLGYHGYMMVIRSLMTLKGGPPELEIVHILGGALVGIAAALSLVSMMRRGVRRPSASSPKTPVLEPAETHRFADDGQLSLRKVRAC